MDFKTLVRRELTPATGCTEPAAIGLAVATARYAIDGVIPSWLPSLSLETEANHGNDGALCDTPAHAGPLPFLDPDRIKSVEVVVDRGIYKNAFSVGVPNSGNQVGIQPAVALGVFSDPELKLNLFSDNRADRLALAQRLRGANKISIKVDTGSGKPGICICATIRIDNSEGKPVEGEAVIEGTHTGVTGLWKNGRPLYFSSDSTSQRTDCSVATHASPLAQFPFPEASIERMIAEIRTISDEARSILLDSARTNMRAGFLGLQLGCGLGVGSNLDGLVTGGNEPPGFSQAVSLAAAASDARMSGQDVPVITSCGSGNQGIVSTVPILVVAALAGKDSSANIDEYRSIQSSVSPALDESWPDDLPDKGSLVQEALGISQAVSYYSMYYEGVLSPLCGCIAKAGLGAAAGLTYLQGGNAAQISASIKLMAANVVGALCDGAKTSCALKCATAAGAAIQSSRLAMKGVDIPSGMGIIGDTAERTIQNVGELSKAMMEADNVIVRLLQQGPLRQ